MMTHLLIAAIAMIVLLSLWAKVGIKDVPSHRSSHDNIVPTASGICVSIVFMAFAVFNQSCEPIPLGFIVGFCLLTVLGFLDDWRELSYKIRLVCQSLSVVCVLITQDLSAIGYLIWFFMGIGLINASNFLDGLNGLLASQWLLTVGFLLAGFAAVNSMFWVLWVCVLIYLFFNFPRARLFMGDTGSTILGFSYFGITFYLTPLQATFPSILIANDSFILFALFPLSFAWCDIAYTLIRRFVEKRSIVNSFADYGFHHLARSFKSHSLVTIIYLGLNSLLVFGAHVLFIEHQFMPIVIGMYILLQSMHLLFIKKIAISKF